MARTYETSHPWLTFSLDTSEFDYRLWMALGEAASKCEHIAGVPLAPEVAKRVHQLYLAKGAAATTAIEGNSLSEEEVERLIDGSLVLPASQQYLADEVQNIIGIANDLAHGMSETDPRSIDPDFIKTLNARVLKGLAVGEDVVPGVVRNHRVIVGRYRMRSARGLSIFVGATMWYVEFISGART